VLVDIFQTIASEFFQPEPGQFAALLAAHHSHLFAYAKGTFQA